MGEYVLFCVLEDFTFRPQTMGEKKRKELGFADMGRKIRELPEPSEKAFFFPSADQRRSVLHTENENRFINYSAFWLLPGGRKTGNGSGGAGSAEGCNRT